MLPEAARSTGVRSLAAEHLRASSARRSPSTPPESPRSPLQARRQIPSESPLRTCRSNSRHVSGRVVVGVRGAQSVGHHQRSGTPQCAGPQSGRQVQMVQQRSLTPQKTMYSSRSVSVDARGRSARGLASVKEQPTASDNVFLIYCQPASSRASSQHSTPGSVEFRTTLPEQNFLQDQLVGVAGGIASSSAYQAPPGLQRRSPGLAQHPLRSNLGQSTGCASVADAVDSAFPAAPVATALRNALAREDADALVTSSIPSCVKMPQQIPATLIVYEPPSVVTSARLRHLANASQRDSNVDRADSSTSATVTRNLHAAAVECQQKADDSQPQDCAEELQDLSVATQRRQSERAMGKRLSSPRNDNSRQPTKPRRSAARETGCSVQTKLSGRAPEVVAPSARRPAESRSPSSHTREPTKSTRRPNSQARSSSVPDTDGVKQSARRPASQSRSPSPNSQEGAPKSTRRPLSQSRSPSPKTPQGATRSTRSKTRSHAGERQQKENKSPEKHGPRKQPTRACAKAKSGAKQEKPQCSQPSLITTNIVMEERVSLDGRVLVTSADAGNLKEVVPTITQDQFAKAARPRRSFETVKSMQSHGLWMSTRHPHGISQQADMAAETIWP